MRRRFSSAVCALAAGSLLLLAGGAGVSGSEAQDALVQTETPKARKIAVLTYAFSSEYWGYVAQGCLACGKNDPAIDVTVESFSSSVAAEEQLAMLKADLEHERYDGYVIAAIDADMVRNALADVSVPVVALDSPLEADCVIGAVGTDNHVAAAAGAKKAVAMAKEIGWEIPECVMIGGVEEDSNHKKRMEGYQSGITDSGGVWLDAVYPTDKSADGAREAMDQIMKDYPEGVAIVACYNDLLAETALKEAEGNKAFSNTVFIGFDGNGSVCERIMNDKRYENMLTVAQNPYEMGFRAVAALAEHMNEEMADEADGGDSAGDASDDPADKGEDGAGGGSADNGGDAAAGDAADNAGDGAVPETGWDFFIDSGYSVITKVNAQERMLQIQSHLS